MRFTNVQMREEGQPPPGSRVTQMKSPVRDRGTGLLRKEEPAGFGSRALLEGPPYFPRTPAHCLRSRNAPGALESLQRRLGAGRDWNRQRPSVILLRRISKLDLRRSSSWIGTALKATGSS